MNKNKDSIETEDLGTRYIEMITYMVYVGS